MTPGPSTAFTPTTPIGFLNFAEAYRKAGQTLATSSGAGGFDGAPVRYCYYHSIELYLKAALIAEGLTEAQLKALGHRFRALAEECNRRDFGLDEPDDLITLDLIDEDQNYIRARYSRVGFFRVATIQRLDNTAQEVALLTVERLRKHGLAVRTAVPALTITSNLLRLTF